MDATTFDAMGNNHMVQNNFGGSLRRPDRAQQDLLLCQLRRLPPRHGRHHDRHRAHAGGNRGRLQHERREHLRSDQQPAQFQYNGVMNVIPPRRSTGGPDFLQNYVPKPNVMMGMMPCGAAMMGSRAWSAQASTATTTWTFATNFRSTIRARSASIRISPAATRSPGATRSASRRIHAGRNAARRHRHAAARLRIVQRQLLAAGQHRVDRVF